jgi:16S rRNA (uracil1498-N3)-methyltransferase
MQLQRFFLPGAPIVTGREVRADSLARQLSSVLRLSPGDRVILLDGTGYETISVITELSSQAVSLMPAARRLCDSEPRLRISLYVCSLKGEKFDWVLQKATEVGVARFVPVVSRRSIVRPIATIAAKYPRYESVIREAAEQSGRALLPELSPPLDFEDVLHTATGDRLILWEGSSISASPPSPAGAEQLSLLVGPEGGFDPEEVSAAVVAGWSVRSLGPRILRAETASIAALAALFARAGDLGDLGP